MWQKFLALEIVFGQAEPLIVSDFIAMAFASIPPLFSNPRFPRDTAVNLPNIDQNALRMFSEIFH